VRYVPPGGGGGEKGWASRREAIYGRRLFARDLRDEFTRKNDVSWDSGDETGAPLCSQEAELRGILLGNNLAAPSQIHIERTHCSLTRQQSQIAICDFSIIASHGFRISRRALARSSALGSDRSVRVRGALTSIVVRTSARCGDRRPAVFLLDRRTAWACALSRVCSRRCCCARGRAWLCVNCHIETRLNVTRQSRGHLIARRDDNILRFTHCRCGC